MKTTPRQYAQALRDLISNKNELEVEKIISSFIIFLNNNNDLNKSDSIIFELESLFKGEDGELNIEVTSARKLSKMAIETLKVFLEKKTKAKDIYFSEIIDPSIIGGFIVRYDDRVINGSLKNNLLYFQKQLSN